MISPTAFGISGDEGLLRLVRISIMLKRQNIRAQFAICIENSGYPTSLELFKVYRILPDEEAAADGDLRVIDESGEDYLYRCGLVCVH